MKNHLYSGSLAALTGVTALALSLFSVAAQDSAAPAPTVTTASSTPRLSYGVSDVLQLSQAKVGDDTIVSYVQNSGRGYSDLNANEIVYLHQQGVSDRVVSAMLNQRQGVAAAAPAPAQTDANAQYQQQQAQSSAVYTAPVNPPASTVYIMRDSSPTLVDYGYYPAYSYPYPYYGFYPGVSFGFNFGGGGFHRGFDGFHRDGGFHGSPGGFHGGGGGSFHGHH